MNRPVLDLVGVSKAWAGRPVLSDIHLQVRAGEHTLIEGASGAGKSTLLGILSRLVQPDAGSVHLDGTDIHHLGSATRYRREYLGLIYQEPQIVDSLTTFQNVEMSSMIHTRRGPAVLELLERLGLADRRDVRAGVLSRGERQRLAIARAFVGQPRLVLADEPTASLDPTARDSVLTQLFTLADDAGSTIVLVSHDTGVATHAAFAARVGLRDGGTHPVDTAAAEPLQT